MNITLVRYCDCETISELLNEIRNPHSKNYWDNSIHKGLIAGVYGENVEIKQINKNNYIGELGNFYDSKNYTFHELQRHIEMKLVAGDKKDMNISSVEELSSYYLKYGTVHQKTNRTMWSFNTNIKNIIGYAGVRLEDNFLCDGIELKPGSKVFNIEKHLKDGYIS